ncbi:MAG: chorismate mutase [Gemmatimonadales bacterium]
MQRLDPVAGPLAVRDGKIPVPGGLSRCLRVLVHVERHWNGRHPRHVYLRDAIRLRPDLAVGVCEPLPWPASAPVGRAPP